MNINGQELKLIDDMCNDRRVFQCPCGEGTITEIYNDLDEDEDYTEMSSTDYVIDCDKCKEEISDTDIQ